MHNLNEQITDKIRVLTPSTPSWWTDEHGSTWELVKDAFKHDWERTKTDLSNFGASEPGTTPGTPTGTTVEHAVGSRSEPKPKPELEEKAFDPTQANDLAETARLELVKAFSVAKETKEKSTLRIAESQQELAGKIDDAQRNTFEAKRKIEENAAKKIATAQDHAMATLQEQHLKMSDADQKRDEASAKWREAEEAARYGYSARSQFPAATLWDSALEVTLKSEWRQLGSGRRWEDAEPSVRAGWEYAGKPR